MVYSMVMMLRKHFPISMKYTDIVMAVPAHMVCVVVLYIIKRMDGIYSFR